MRKLPKDIIEEMKSRFDSGFNIANKLLTDYVNKDYYLDSDRIIRCIIFLSDNGIESFKSSLELAKVNP